MYHSKFDCPPGVGVTCTPVSTLEKMIVESPCGEDDFLGCVPKLVDVQKDPACGCTLSNDHPAPFQRRIWIAPRDCGKAFYIYFNEDYSCEEF